MDRNRISINSLEIIAPLFCCPDANGKDVIKLLLRVVRKNEAVKDVQYKLIEVDRNKPFYKIYQSATKLTEIRLFELEVLTGNSKRFPK